MSASSVLSLDTPDSHLDYVPPYFTSGEGIDLDFYEFFDSMVGGKRRCVHSDHIMLGLFLLIRAAACGHGTK
jgi:hypothetical protein